ncbi:MAG: penicillin-binding transpeptidase domain-containing protein, partial [Deltaproteobacteria bacterium]|nr:penicillin-binding transpeptidase domain-containing protein [Deltaproteobacteria bacterium]
MIDLSRKYSLNFRAFYLLTTSFLAIFSLCLVSLFYTYTWIGKKLVTSKKISETILTFRSNIFDRNGLALAASRISADLYVHPNRVNDKERIAELFHRYLKLDYETTLNILKTNKNYHVLARHIDQDLAQSITRLIGRPDLVGYHKTFSRDYMFSDSLLPLLGKVSAAGAGSFGLELMLDKSLIKKASSSLSFQNGVVTTIDSEIQKSLDEAVEWSINEFKAKRVLGVVLDAHQGDILAYSQIDSQKTPIPKFLLTELVFEPGSTFKPFSLAIVLDLNLTRPDEILNCENGKFRLGRHIIRDVHPYSFLTVEETLMKSSNICTG